MDIKNLTLKQNRVSDDPRHHPDDRSGDLYDFTDDLLMATKVALATGRPLLLRGEPGSGKSSYAPFVARNLNWRFYDHVVTARTEAGDLKYQVDLVQRLADAQASAGGNSQLCPLESYVEPKALWWAYNPQSAKTRGSCRNDARSASDPYEEINNNRSSQGAVVLIDEIDKGDPDVPNNLLVAIGSRQFRVDELDIEIACDTESEPASPLIIVTTNQERALPQAFLRRCVIHELAEPDLERLLSIARIRMPDFDEDIVRRIAEKTMALREETPENHRRPSIAEFLDALRASERLEVGPGHGLWESIEKLTLRKRQA